MCVSIIHINRCARRVPPAARAGERAAAAAPHLRTAPPAPHSPAQPCSALHSPPSLHPSPPASAEPQPGEHRATAALRGSFWPGAERSGAGERHKREGRRKSPSHAPLPQVYDGGPEEQRCSAATARLLKTCCSAFLGKVDAYCVFSLCFLFFFFFFPPPLFPLWLALPCAGGGCVWGGYTLGEGLSSQRVPQGGPSRVSPRPAGERGGWGRACVRCVPPSPCRPLGTVSPRPLFIPGAAVTVPAPGRSRTALPRLPEDGEAPQSQH